MTLEEAEEYYKRYNGLSFHMFREEPTNYRIFSKLNIHPAILEQWDMDMIEDQYNHLYDKLDTLWISFDKIVSLVNRLNHDQEAQVARLLDEMDKIVGLKLKKKTQAIIVETVNGRNQQHTDGVVALVSKYPEHGERFAAVMDSLLAKMQDDSFCDEFVDGKLRERMNRDEEEYRKAAKLFLIK